MLGLHALGPTVNALWGMNAELHVCQISKIEAIFDLCVDFNYDESYLQGLPGKLAVGQGGDDIGAISF